MICVHVGRLSSLEQLDLEYTKITDRGVQHLTGLTELRYLSLGGTLITDEAMQSIGKLTNLEDLLIGGTRVGDAGMAHLSDLKNLRSLDIGATNVGDKGLAASVDSATTPNLLARDPNYRSTVSTSKEFPDSSGSWPSTTPRISDAGLVNLGKPQPTGNALAPRDSGFRCRTCSSDRPAPPAAIGIDENACVRTPAWPSCGGICPICGSG